MQFFIYLLFNILIASVFLSIYLLGERNLGNFSVVASLIFSVPFLLFFPYSFSMAVEILSTMAMNLLYTSRSFIYIGSVAVVLLITVTLHLSSNVSAGMALAIGVGISISLLLSNNMRKNAFVNNQQRGNLSNVEVRRDILQILSGIALIFAFFVLPQIYIKVTLVFLVILAIFLLNFSGIYRDSGLSKFIMSFERKNVQPGIGSLWYIAGVLLLMGLTGGTGALLVGVFCMAIGDSVATIVGMNIRTFRLPYNRKKSFGGFASMLLVTSLFAYFFFGAFYIIYAIIATVAESVSGYPVDDNFSIPFSVIVLRSLVLFV